EVELSDRRLNTLVSETTSEVWKHVDCRSCANCCRTRQPVFSRKEAQRIAAYLGISLEELRARYLTSDAENGKYITQSLPCTSLECSRCSMNEVRPAVCADHPN